MQWINKHFVNVKTFIQTNVFYFCPTFSHLRSSFSSPCFLSFCSTSLTSQSLSHFTSCSSHQTENVVCREPVTFSIFMVLKATCEVKVKVLRCVWLLLTPWTSPWNSTGQNTGVGSLSFLQGIFPTQGSNPGLLHCRRVLYQLSHKGSPRTLERVAYPFTRGSSRPRNWTRVIHIADRFFTNWAIREATFTIFMI